MKPYFVKTTKGIFINANNITMGWVSGKDYQILYTDSKGCQQSAMIDHYEATNLFLNN